MKVNTFVQRFVLNDKYINKYQWGINVIPCSFFCCDVYNYYYAEEIYLTC